MLLFTTMNSLNKSSFIIDKFFEEMKLKSEDGTAAPDEIPLSPCDSEVFMLKKQLKTLNLEIVSLKNSLKDRSDINSRSSTYNSIDTDSQKDMQSSVHSHSELPRTVLADLIHMYGPLTEDSIIKTLHQRWTDKHYYTTVGPVLISLNADNGNGEMNRALWQPEDCPYLLNMVKETVRQQTETGCSQSIILSGASGSGKTYTAMVVLRQLYDIAGGGPETDGFKHVSSSLTVLQSLGNVQTPSNPDSSRMGQFIEAQISDGVIFRTKIHCYFLDQTRITNTLPSEANYHIFYQMLAGLSNDEKVKFHLHGYSISNLSYLKNGTAAVNDFHLERDKERFELWKSSLLVLGIPFTDVMRVMAAVLLLGNIEFVKENEVELDIQGNNEIKAVAALLGVSGVSLFRGITTRTSNVRGQAFKFLTDAEVANTTRDVLAKSLYARTVSAIVRKANSVRKTGSNSGTSSSSDDMHNNSDNHSLYKQTCPLASKSSVSHGPLSEGFIGIVDMFGFENVETNRLEQLCINLCSESLQNFYNTKVFKNTVECCRDEGVPCDIEVNYYDSSPCIELITSPNNGILTLLDEVSLSSKCTCQSLMEKISGKHSSTQRFFKTEDSSRKFGIVHYADSVVYDTSYLINTNKDLISDDIVSVFQKQNCNFGFVSHLFTSDLKANQGCSPGHLHRISPGIHNSDHCVQRTFMQDFRVRFDNLLKTLHRAKPHFIRCIKPNNRGNLTIKFDSQIVRSQVRALQILETVHFMSGGYPHKMPFTTFNQRYKFLARHKKLRKSEEKAHEDTKILLDGFLKAMDESKIPYASTNWAVGKRHIFLSEGARQCLEKLRHYKREEAATVIQTAVRSRICINNWPRLKQALEMRKRFKQTNSRARLPPPAPPLVTSGPKPPHRSRKCDLETLKQTCFVYGLDLDNPPPIPRHRQYTINGSRKITFPQNRAMKHNFSVTDRMGREHVLNGGDVVRVIGSASQRGFLLVEDGGVSIHVPHQLLELQNCNRKYEEVFKIGNR